MDTGTPEVLFEKRGSVGWLTFNRPAARNAMTYAMYDAIARVCDGVEADESVRALVLRGAGEKAFVAGTDIAQFTELTLAQHARDYEARMEAVLGRLERLPRPTIAAVRGACVGGGAAIAVCCDLRLCSPDARFGVPVARTLGNCLSAANLARVMDLIGPSRTKQLLFTAELATGEQALAWGLVNEVVQPDQLEARAQALAEQIAANAPITVQCTKEAVRRVQQARRAEVEDDDLILKAYLSEDFREGVASFLARRPPVWRGR